MAGCTVCLWRSGGWYDGGSAGTGWVCWGHPLEAGGARARGRRASGGWVEEDAYEDSLTLLPLPACLPACRPAWPSCPSRCSRRGRPTSTPQTSRWRRCSRSRSSWTPPPASEAAREPECSSPSAAVASGEVGRPTAAPTPALPPPTPPRPLSPAACPPTRLAADVQYDDYYARTPADGGVPSIPCLYLVYTPWLDL